MIVKNRKLKIVILSLLCIVMLAGMAILPLTLRNASAEEEINTTDEYIIRDIQVGDDLSGVTLLIDFTNIDTAEFENLSDNSGPVVISDAFMIFYGNGAFAYLLEITDKSAPPITIENIYNPGNYTTVTEYVMPSNFGVVLSVNEEFTAGIKILGLNPDYIPPVEEPEPTPETPNTGIEDFLSKELIAGFSIGMLLLILLIYKIFVK